MQLKTFCRNSIISITDPVNKNYQVDFIMVIRKFIKLDLTRKMFWTQMKMRKIISSLPYLKYGASKMTNY